MSQGFHPILQVVKLRPRGVLDPALQRARDAAPWVCRALGGVFQCQRDCSLLARGGFQWGLLLCQGVHTLCHPTSRGSQGAFPCPEKGTCRGPVSHTSAVAPVPSSLAAPSRPYLPGMVTPAAPAASRRNQWGAHGPYPWASCGLGLPAIPISRAAPDLGPRGASPIPAALGPGLGALPRPHADRCGGMLEGAGTSLPSPEVSVTLLELQGPS